MFTLSIPEPPVEEKYLVIIGFSPSIHVWQQPLRWQPAKTNDSSFLYFINLRIYKPLISEHLEILRLIRNKGPGALIQTNSFLFLGTDRSQLYVTAPNMLDEEYKVMTGQFFNQREVLSKTKYFIKNYSSLILYFNWHFFFYFFSLYYQSF